jgi:uncharacterized protein (TIGR00369 family)
MSMPEMTVDADLVKRIVEDGIPHCKELNTSIVTVDIPNRRVTMKLPYDRKLVGNPATGVLHGGAITSLVDTVCGAALMASLDKMVAVATLDLRIDYLRPATPEKDVLATAEVYRMTRQIAFIRATAYHDDTDKPIASCVGAFMIGSSGKPVMPGDKAEGGDAA